MTTVYFDSSALVKLVLIEDGSEVAAELWDRAAVVVTSRLALPEVEAALAAALRAGRLSTSRHRRALDVWRLLRRGLQLVELDESVTDLAGDLSLLHGLSGADAVHLASASCLPRPVVAVWDERLRRAAIAAGCAVVSAPLE